VVDRRVSWGEMRLYYFGAEGRLSYIPESWTDLAAPDPHIVLGDGSVHFRVEDLLRLVRRIEALSEGRKESKC